MSKLEAKGRKATLLQHQGGGAVLKALISLLVAATAVLMLAPAGFAQASYTWQIDCNADATGVGTGVNWVWLHNGVQISLDSQWVGFAACVSTPLSGSGVVPATINGIQVNGIQVTTSLSESPAGCDAFGQVTKSFDPSNPKFSINDSVSAPSNNGYKPNPAKCAVPGASFRFNISTS